MRSLSLSTAFVGVALTLVAGCGDPSPDPDAGTADRDADPPVTVCARAADCDDGLYCNGAERCEPGAATADEAGCVRGDAPCPASACDEATDDCGCAEDADRDGDGHDSVGCGGDDCDDDDANRFPGNAEVCDAEGHDEDCDLDTLAGATGDADDDGYVATGCCGPDGAGGTVCGRDCDDGANAVNPGTSESCNGTDDDCDGATDEGVLTTFYADVDDDLYGDPTSSVDACAAPADHVAVAGDCDDGDRMVNPAAAERCNDADDDCDGTTDEEATELGTREHCSACGDACQLRCDAGACDAPVQLAVADTATCARTAAGRLYCWGRNADRELGTTTLSNSSIPVPASAITEPVDDVDAGRLHFCARLTPSGTNPRAACWGYNMDGQASGGSSGASSAPTEVAGPIGSTTLATEAGGNSSMLRQTGGVVTPAGWLGWGNNMQGQLATGDRTRPSSPASMSGAPAELDYVSLGIEHGCGVVTSTGSVYCWGRNANGRTGLGTDADWTLSPTQVAGLTDIAQVEAGGPVSVARTTAGRVYAWGVGALLGVAGPYSGCGGTCETTPVALPDFATIVDVAASGTHACGVSDAGEVWCWGANDYGQLGTGSMDPEPTPTIVPTISDAIDVEVSVFSTCALLSTGQILCWGWNEYGQLGEGTTDDRLTPTPVAPPAD